jgi:hypothetical protein
LTAEESKQDTHRVAVSGDVEVSTYLEIAEGSSRSSKPKSVYPSNAKR